MISPGSKLPDVGTTIFTVMSKMAVDFDAINLSQGFPDFDTGRPAHSDAIKTRLKTSPMPTHGRHRAASRGYRREGPSTLRPKRRP